MVPEIIPIKLSAVQDANSSSPVSQFSVTLMLGWLIGVPYLLMISSSNILYFICSWTKFTSSVFIEQCDHQGTIFLLDFRIHRAILLPSTFSRYITRPINSMLKEDLFLISQKNSTTHTIHTFICWICLHRLQSWWCSCSNHVAWTCIFR